MHWHIIKCGPSPPPPRSHLRVSPGVRLPPPLLKCFNVLIIIRNCSVKWERKGSVGEWSLTDPWPAPPLPAIFCRSVLCGLSTRGSIRDPLGAVSHSATSLNSVSSICCSMCVREPQFVFIFTSPCGRPLAPSFLLLSLPLSLYFSRTLPLSSAFPPSLRPSPCVCLWRC